MIIIIPVFPPPPSTSTSTSTFTTPNFKKGWTLLEDICLSTKCRGTVPLMRNTEGSIVCVACSSEIVSEIVSTTTRNVDSEKIKIQRSNQDTNNQDLSDEESDFLKVQKLFDDKPSKSLEVNKFNEAGYFRTICILEKVFIYINYYTI